MTRVKRGLMVKKRHKKILKQVKGFRGARKHRLKLAKEALLKALSYAYRDRRRKKREFRRLWIVKINAALKPHQLSYSRFIQGLKKGKISLNRKMLAELALSHPKKFEDMVKKAKEALSSSSPKR